MVDKEAGLLAVILIVRRLLSSTALKERSESMLSKLREAGWGTGQLFLKGTQWEEDFVRCCFLLPPT